jgi:S-(hydroxymethyl)glutathione dehydrogenase/alcohol dehydrogenase
MPAVECRAAVDWGDSDRWSIETVQIDAPRRGEVLVRMLAAGLCQTDRALVQGGYPEIGRPVIGGHEGVGVVEEVGPAVTGLAPGDSVLFLIPVPPCGRCPTCRRGLTHLCDSGGRVAAGRQLSDGTARHHARGQELGAFVLLGLFAEYTVVHEASLLRISPELAAADVCPVGCAGVTGWGAVQNTAELRGGEAAVIVGVGGVGANAVQAARFRGAQAVLAVDPVPARRQLARDLGADDAVADVAAARERVAELTGGRMADAVVLTTRLGGGALLASSMALLGKRGRLVVVDAHPGDDPMVALSLRDLQESEKQIRGCMVGSWHGRTGAAFLLDLAARGHYDPSAITSRSYGLTDIDRGYAEQARGKVVRGVLDLTT